MSDAADIGVSVRRVSRAFGSYQALRSVDLEVPRGRLLTLLGASGCGKTTLLRIIAGFETSDAGEVRLAGDDVSAIPVWQRRIGFVFQSYALWPHMTVAENVAYGLVARGLGRDAVATKVAAGLAQVGLTGREHRRPGQLSGGQQQRVALARALVLDPQVLLLDEPLSNLDALLRVEMRREIRRVQQETKITAIYVTHDQEEALEISDIVAVMNQGRIEQVGTPEDIYGSPATEFVASFVGSVSLVRGTVCSDGALAVASDRRLPLGLDRRFDGRAVTVAIRPEDARVVDRTSDANLVGRVVATSFLGRARSSIVEVAADVRITCHHRDRIEVGREIALAVDRHTVIPS